MIEPQTLREINAEIAKLDSYDWLRFDKRVLSLIDTIRKENAQRVAELKARAEALRSKRTEPKPRWPDNTPSNVMTACLDYWSGTEESRSFRIHLWNDKAVWTSYPAGGYSTLGGWVKTTSCYYLLSLSERENNCGHQKPKRIMDREGRQKPTELQKILDDL